MRISGLLTFASITFGLVSALTIPINKYENSSTGLERRTAQENHPNHGRVTIHRKAQDHLQKVLGLEGDAEKVVKDYHKNTVAAEMDKHNAHSAQIRYLAHTEGSADPIMHITATFKDHEGKPIPSKYGHPEKTGARHHIYTGQLPKEYEDARQKHKEYLANDLTALHKHVAKQAASKAAKMAQDNERAKKKEAQDSAKKEKAARTRESGILKSHGLAGDAKAHTAHRKAEKEEKKARKAEKVAKAHQAHGK